MILSSIPRKYFHLICSNFFLLNFQAVLNETSYGLHRLTQRQGLIKEFDIILPKSWHVPSCEPGRQMTSVQRANPARPDVFIDAKVKLSFYFILFLVDT